jgi:hypothetical protein
VDFVTLLSALRVEYPSIEFIPAKVFYWSPKKQAIMYRQGVKNQTEACFTLLHETGHALLDHKHFSNDFELLSLEVAAWEKAKQIAPAYQLEIDEDHLQDCLDSYRDWLFRRALCPVCATTTLQQDSSSMYRCHNCHATWQVAKSRFCRPYRQKTGQDKTIVTLP